MQIKVKRELSVKIVLHHILLQGQLFSLLSIAKSETCSPLPFTRLFCRAVESWLHNNMSVQESVIVRVRVPAWLQLAMWGAEWRLYMFGTKVRVPVSVLCTIAGWVLYGCRHAPQSVWLSCVHSITCVVFALCVHALVNHRLSWEWCFRLPYFIR